MTLHQFRIFSSVARLLNVTKASAELHISQPSVSQQLKLLQEEFGAKLYKKTARGIELTKEGGAFLKDIAPILFQVEKVKKKFHTNLTGHSTDSFSVGGSFAPSLSVLPSIVAVFKETHPRLQLALRTDTSYAVERMVLNAEAEIAVITTPSYSPFLIYEPRWRVNLVAFQAAKHPLVKKEDLTLMDLAQIPLVIKKGKPYESRTRRFLNRLEKKGLHPNVVMECESVEAVKAAVRTGVGIGILSRDLVEPDIHRGDLKPVTIRELKMEISSFVIYKKERPLSAHAQEFLTLVRQWRLQGWSKRSLRAA